MNQLNRIKLMISVAKANLAEKESEARAARDTFVNADGSHGKAQDAGKLEVETELA